MDEIRHQLAQAIESHRLKSWDWAMKLHQVYDDSLWWISDKLEPYGYEGPNGKRERG